MTAAQRWLDKLPLGTSIVVFCAGLIVVTWAGLWMHVATEQERIVAAVMQQNTNIAMLFEEHVIRTLRAADVTLRQVKAEYEKYGTRFDLVRYARDRRIFLDSYNAISIVGDNGDRLLASDSDTTPRNFAAGENFQFHAAHASPELFISKPRRGAISGKWSIFLSHRLDRADGVFGGQVILALDAMYFSRFYNQIDLGADSVVALIGRDGIVRARQSNQASEPGADLSATRLISVLLPSAGQGCYTAGSRSDGVRRLVCYRALKDFPLVVAVGVSEAVAMTPFRQRRTVYFEWAAGLTAVIVCFAALAILQTARQRRTDRELQESDERFQRAMTASAVGIWDWDMSHKHYNLSPQFKTLLGVDSPGWAFTLREFRERLHPADRKRALAAIPRHIKAHARFGEEFRLRCGDGEYRWFHIRGQALWDSAGGATGFSGTVIDITAAKKAEEMRARLTAIVESSQDAIVSRAPDGTVLTWNKGAERLFGYSAAEMIGANIRVIAPPDRMDELQRKLDGTLSSVEMPAYETQRITKDGRRIHVSVSASRILDGAGRVERVAVIFRDIGERVEAEKHLRLAAAVFDTTQEGIIVSDAANRIISVNPAFTTITGYTPAEVIGTRASPLSSGMHGKVFYRSMRTAIRATGRWQGELWAPRRNGERYCALLSITTVRNSAGQIIQHCAIFVDITRRKHAEAELVRLNSELENRVSQRTRELEHTNRDLEAFSYSVSHDLRAPLRSIAGFGGFLLKDSYAQLDAEGRSRLQRILAATARMEQLIDDLMKLARISRQVVARREVNLHAMAEEIITMLRDANPQRQIESVIAPDLVIDADPGLMRVVFDNLLGNAWKFTGRRTDARIEVGTALKHGKPVYFVRDNGDGFDMSYAAKLFTPFQRMHTQQQFEGSGIGLATVKRIIELHHGHVWIESAPGRGTTVSFTLGESV